MSLFENFPYTNLHNLNLDWIVSVIKKLDEMYPDFEAELKAKLNKPENEGTIGDILTYLGNDSTKWISFQDYSVPTIIQAVNDWLDEHPEATTTVEDDSITMAKLYPNLRNIINNLNTRPSGVGVYETSKVTQQTIQGSMYELTSWMEGVEYNSNRERYIFAFARERDDPLLIETDANFVFIRGITLTGGGHANDITYNPNTDKYYIATMNTVGQLISVDATTLSIDSLITPASIVGEINRISYDRENDCFYLFNTIEGTGNFLYKSNADFSESTVVFPEYWQYSVENGYKNISRILGQGSTMFDGHFVGVFWFEFEHDPAVTRLSFADITNSTIDYIFDFQNTHRWDEAETIVNVNNQLTVFSSYNHNIIITNLSTNGNASVKHNRLAIKQLPHYIYNENNTGVLDDLGIQTGEDEIYSYWVAFTSQPADAWGSQNIVEGQHRADGYGYQTMKSYNNFYFRSLDNNNWLGWYDILQKQRATTENILNLALNSSSGGFKYYQYTGSDYSWLPFQNDSFVYASFEIQYIGSARIVTAVNTNNKIIARNMYINGAWTGWNVSGSFSTTENVLTLAQKVAMGNYSVRYTGNDSTWLPNANYIYGIYEISNISASIIKVTACTYNNTQFATNIYMNGSWSGWKVYS